MSLTHLACLPDLVPSPPSHHMAFSWHLGMHDLADDDDDSLGLFGADGVAAKATGWRTKASRCRGDPNVLASQRRRQSFDPMRALAKEMNRAACIMRMKRRQAGSRLHGPTAAGQAPRCPAKVPCRRVPRHFDSGVLEFQRPRSRYHVFMQQHLKAPRQSGTSSRQHFQAGAALWHLQEAAEEGGKKRKHQRKRRHRLDQAERAAAAEARKEANKQNLAKAWEKAEKDKEKQAQVCASLTGMTAMQLACCLSLSLSEGCVPHCACSMCSLSQG